MEGSDEPLPDDLDAALDDLLDEATVGFWPGVEELCAQQPRWSTRLREEARAREEQKAGIRAAPRTLPTPPPKGADAIPTHIGPYRIFERLGVGGMGEVFKGERLTPTRQFVAIKVIKEGMATKEVLARFKLEQRALASMNHRAIARVYDAGATEKGEPYFVMEFISGLPLTEYCDKHKLTLEVRIAVFQQICGGVQHAHQKGFVHRDLKPGNILLARDGDEVLAKVLDFGLAKAMSRDVLDATVYTEHDRVMGTYEYMSPEQAAGDGEAIDARTDIYALGAILYELLLGELPFPGLRKAGHKERVRQICEEVPGKPSTRLVATSDHTSQLAARRRTSVGALRRALRGGLDWVVMKALAKEPERRYASAAALAADLGRYLKHEPLEAGPPSFGYRARTFARRYPAQLAAATLTLLAMLGALGTSMFYWQAADTARAGEAAKAAEAQHNAELFAGKVGEFEQLKGVVLYDRAIEVEKTLYPAWPHQVAALERWLQDDAGKLLSMRGQIEQTVRSLRERALPATPEQIAHDKTSHPKSGDLQKQAARLASIERAHAIRTNAQVLSLPLPTAEEQAMTPSQLNTIAWPRVDFDETKRTWGEEAHALTLAKLAWDKTAGLADAERYQLGDTLAWAWFANGKDDEARAQSEAALALAPAAEKAAYESHLTTLQAKVQAASGEGGTKALVDLRALVSTLDAEVSARRTFAFADESQRFLHDTLSDLLTKLGSLDANERKAVDTRLSWARRIGALTQNYPNTPSWNDARKAIGKADGVVASELYRGQKIELRDQDVVGLVPIGMNPVTKLWEFYELASAWDGVRDPATLAIPRYVSKGDDHGYLEVGADTGIVFVLLPGGTFTMGTQADDPNAPSYDPQRKADETLHEVTLAPFFLARHELTKGQWKRLSGGGEPSWHGIGKAYHRPPEAIGYAHPVEQVDWDVSVELLGRHGMVLPTEAQWEYGGRAGTTTPWWTGSSAASLSGAANVLDKRGEASQPQWGRPEGDFDDGRVGLGPVAQYRANAFGLFDVHGNVWEWTRDGDHGTAAVPRIGDGLRGDPRSSPDRVYRGGSFEYAARFARSGYRDWNAPVFRYSSLGLRPGRPSRLHD